ncbi:MFS general substrate transporter [Mycena indigotica]|uniref:MFS general substrate transporter n=1 Tax=Mycena indigotica TaxID=2126181 RepID=A0A8H6S9X6_9AGAR|nr:MFS general substrate transporter [Mycena indigotica]KAF7295686.1 MFS general substrate transporter [Mycena indigotica]
MNSHFSLPDELLGEIFEHCLPPYPACPPFRGLGSPTTLAQVCPRWKSVAHGTPRLWRAIKLDLDPSNKNHITGTAARKRLDIAEAWLERSRSLPLSIVFHCPTHTMTPILSDAFATLLSHCSRWQYADIMVPASIPVEEQAGGEWRAMPMLLELQVYVHSADTEPHLGRLRPPNLKTFVGRLTDDSYYCEMLASEVWQNLTTLELNDIPLQDIAPLLSQTHALVHCWLDIWNHRPVDDFPDIQLPNLETLILKGHGQAGDTNTLLTSLTLPALQQLGILDAFIVGFAPADSDTHINSLVSLVQKLGCRESLTQLAIVTEWNVWSTYADDIQVALPSLRQLHLKPKEWLLALRDFWSSKTLL